MEIYELAPPLIMNECGIPQKTMCIVLLFLDMCVDNFIVCMH